jgi:6-pyruvoyltetrahydropterin/6-carboxytetrahydropterin synthase
MARVNLTRRFDFVASHALAGMEAGHICARPHAHNYGLEVTLAPVDELINGLVVDPARLAVDVRAVIDQVKARALNDIQDPAPWAQKLAGQPTLENLALYFWHALAFLSNSAEFRLVSLRVYQDMALYAEVTG